MGVWGKIIELFKGQAAIDLFFLLVFVRIIYISLSRGSLRENFKIIGLLVSSFFAFQYYPLLGDDINAKIPFINKEFLYFISFSLIFSGIIIAFGVTGTIITLFLKRDEIDLAERWFLLFAGIFRAAFLSSVIFFLFHLSPIGSKRFSGSISYRVFKNIEPKIYLIAANGYSKFYPKAELNREVKTYYEAESVVPEGDSEGD